MISEKLLAAIESAGYTLTPSKNNASYMILRKNSWTEDTSVYIPPSAFTINEFADCIYDVAMEWDTEAETSYEFELSEDLKDLHATIYAACVKEGF